MQDVYDGWNNENNSWACGKDVQYDFCYKHWWEYERCLANGGQSGAGTAKAAHMGGFMDEMSSLWLKRYDVESAGAATAFREKDCQGYVGRFEAGPGG